MPIKNIYFLEGIEPKHNAIDDSISTLSSIRASKYVAQYRAKAEEWIKVMHNFQQSIETISNCQVSLIFNKRTIFPCLQPALKHEFNILSKSKDMPAMNQASSVRLQIRPVDIIDRFFSMFSSLVVNHEYENRKDGIAIISSIFAFAYIWAYDRFINNNWRVQFESFACDVLGSHCPAYPTRGILFDYAVDSVWKVDNVAGTCAAVWNERER